MAVIDGTSGDQEQRGEQPRTPVSERTCRVHWFAGRMHEVLDDVSAAGLSMLALGSAQSAETVVELLRAADRIQGLALQVLAHADRIDVGAESGAVSTGAWLGTAVTVSPARAHRTVKLARRLEAEFENTSAALSTGSIDVDQAQVIVSSVDALPAFVGSEERRRAERHLIDEARQHDAKKLQMLGKHLLHVIDPDAADEELARRLEEEEAAAARKTYLRVFDDGKGTSHGSFRIPSLHGAMLTVALEALASPRLPDPIGREVPADPDDPESGTRSRPRVEVLGEAFCQLLERFPTKKLPKAGGGLVTVIVTMELQKLLDGLGAATMSTGGYASAGQVRRLACSAGILPAIFGSESQLLDLGRKVRLHTEPQRLAMAMRDKTCTAEGCQVPAAWCHAHHRVPWAEGGRTSVADGRMVCGRHHTMIHRPTYESDYLSNGKIRITRRRRQ